MTADFIPLSVPNLKGRELELVTTAVETEWVSTGGPYVSQFEENIAEYVNAKGLLPVKVVPQVFIPLLWFLALRLTI